MPTKDDIILIADPRVLAIPLRHNTEPLVDLRQQTSIVYGPSPEIPDNQDYTFVRQTIYDKLLTAQQQLPNGYHFCLYEGYRSLALQKLIFDERYGKVQTRYPTWSSDQIFLETIKLVSPVINQDGSDNVPPHATGAAIDVYLLDDAGQALDMGIHPEDWMMDVSGAKSLTDSKEISETAIKNRRLMSDVLTAVGFVNYPTEYWHWSYGDRYWAFMTKAPQTLYDLANHSSK
ncbi:MAG: M15 family metallopeptidase [Gammaproteobacteria bacterium]|nr:M15 family metallopeptidase [Gammaproteobacteria bacterium]